MSINLRIEELRNAEKLSRGNFGKKIGKSIDAVYNIERGRAAIKPDLIDLICKTFYVNKDWLLNGEGDMYYISKESLDIGGTISKILDSEKLSILTSQLVNLSDDKIKVIEDLINLLSENEK